MASKTGMVVHGLHVQPVHAVMVSVPLSRKSRELEPSMTKKSPVLKRRVWNATFVTTKRMENASGDQQNAAIQNVTSKKSMSRAATGTHAVT